MTAMPTVVVPMAPTLLKLPFSNPDWLFEPKWDGYRAICFVQDGEVRLVSKNKRSLNERFPDLRNIGALIRATSAVLDGEIVALDKKGVPCFDGLRSKKTASECMIVYFAFELLYLDGRSLTQSPLVARKTALKKILPRRDTGTIDVLWNLP